jgi:general secretion pathway protein F
LAQAAAGMSEAARRGAGELRVPGAAVVLPPMLVWLLTSASSQGGLPQALRQAAESYRRRALHQAEVARVFAPVVLTVLVGGTATLVYVLSVFVPWATLLKQIT